VSSICFLDRVNAACFALGCFDGPERHHDGPDHVGVRHCTFRRGAHLVSLGFFLGSGEAILSTDQVSWRLAYGLVGVLLVAYLAEACVAAPLHRELERRGSTSLLAYWLVGAATGAAPFAAYGLVEVLARLRSPAGSIQGIDLRFAAGWGAIGILFGVASATLFWWTFIRRTRSTSSMSGLEVEGESMDTL
jgi:hypothetical protein